jgi:hypothetical protein
LLHHLRLTARAFRSSVWRAVARFAGVASALIIREPQRLSLGQAPVIRRERVKKAIT